MNFPKEILIGCDHAGFELKEWLKKHLAEKVVSVKDFGTYSLDSVDYPDFAHPLAAEIDKHPQKMGILICGSANGVAITANKHQHVRAALCWMPEIASLARQHNDANVICIPARFVTEATALEMVNLFFTTDFEGGRHAKRVEKISC